MGKKSKTEPASDAHQRINFLYQACFNLAKCSGNSKLTSYYGFLAKEVSRKIVGKLHPRIKRSLCSACNAPLLPDAGFSKPKIITGVNKKKRRKNLRVSTLKTTEECSNLNCRLLKIEQSNGEQENLEIQSNQNIAKGSVVRPTRKTARDKHPNRLVLSCPQCGYRRSILQRPSYKFWIDYN